MSCDHTVYHVITGDMATQYGSVFRRREANLMKICDWQGMSDDQWTSVLKVVTNIQSSSSPVRERIAFNHFVNNREFHFVGEICYVYGKLFTS